MGGIPIKHQRAGSSPGWSPSQTRQDVVRGEYSSCGGFDVEVEDHPAAVQGQ
jgi:hypothetical protein